MSKSVTGAFISEAFAFRNNNVQVYNHIYVKIGYGGRLLKWLSR